MDAQELQRLKDLAQAAMGESDDDWYGPEFLRMQLNFSEDESKFVTAATPSAIMELITDLAVAKTAIEAHQNAAKHRQDKIAKLETLLAERAVSPAESMQSVDTIQFQELLAEYAKHLTTTMWKVTRRRLIEHIDASRAAAHAEGRRSAMEELAKEKERADRAEARIAEVVASATASVDSLTKERTALVTQLSSRQAPDLGKLKRLELEQGVAGAYMVDDKNGDYVEFADMQSLLAQPLQQEGGKVIKPDEDLDWLAKLDDQNAVFSQQAAQQLWEWYTAAHTRAQKWKAKAIALQPSDNLQQASTAQGEPAKDIWADDINPAHVAAYDAALQEAASATDAGHPLGDHDRGQLSRWGRHIEALSGVFSDERALMCRQVNILLSRITYRGTTPAQATPEGADLPPLPEPCQSVYPSGWIRYTADQMRNYARAALAATTAAEPVAWSYECLQPLTSPPIWCEFFSREKPVNENEPWMRNVVPLYRAAPPQQKEET